MPAHDVTSSIARIAVSIAEARLEHGLSQRKLAALSTLCVDDPQARARRSRQPGAAGPARRHAAGAGRLPAVHAGAAGAPARSTGSGRHQQRQLGELLGELDDDQADDENEWGVKRALDVGTTLAGCWRGQEEWQGDYGPTPVYLMTDGTGAEFLFFGGRSSSTGRSRRRRRISATASRSAGSRTRRPGRTEPAVAGPGRRQARRRNDPHRRGREASEDADDDIPF